MRIPAFAQQFANNVRRFHRDEHGESSTLTNIMLLVVAALVVVALIAFGETAMKKLQEWWDKISGSNITPVT